MKKWYVALLMTLVLSLAVGVAMAAPSVDDITNANDGDVLDFSGAGTLTLDSELTITAKNLTIKNATFMAGKSYSAFGSAYMVRVMAEGVTFENVIFDMNGQALSGMMVNPDCSATVNNCKVLGSATKFLTGGTGTAGLAVNGGKLTVTGNNTKVEAMYPIIVLRAADGTPAPSVDIIGGEFTGRCAVYFGTASATAVPGYGTVNVKDAKFTTTNNYANGENNHFAAFPIQTSNNTLTIDNCEVELNGSTAENGSAQYAFSFAGFSTTVATDNTINIKGNTVFTSNKPYGVSETYGQTGNKIILRNAGIQFKNNDLYNAGCADIYYAEGIDAFEDADGNWVTQEWTYYELYYEGGEKVYDGESVFTGKGELVFESPADLDELDCVYIEQPIIEDGEWVDVKLIYKTNKTTNYVQLSEGSTVVTLTEDFLKTLADGEYLITIVSEKGVAGGLFNVAKVAEPAATPTPAPVAPSTPSVPKTGDESNIALWIALMALAAAGIVIAGKKARFN